MNIVRGLWAGLFLLLLTSVSLSASAQCRRVSPSINAGCDLCGISTGLDQVNLTNTYLPPVGMLPGSRVFGFTSGVRYPDPDKVLYECDASDAGQIFEVFATNGDDRVGGYFDLGAIDGNPHYFATYFPYVGIRLTHLDSGNAFRRYWQSAPITRYATSGDKIQIRVKESQYYSC